MASAAEVLRAQWGASCVRLDARLTGLTDDEFLWEPCASCWSVRPGDAGRWVMDYVVPGPEPAPVTTIAWRMQHIAHGNWMYWEHSFGPAAKTFFDLPNFGTAEEAIADLVASQQRVTSTLADVDDEGLDEERPTHFGVTWPARRVLATLVEEQVHHGAEIGLLRDLYRWRR